MSPRKAAAFTHPNRETARAQTTRAVLVALLLGSAGLTLFLMIVTWGTSQGFEWIQIVGSAVYAMLALMIVRWSRGALALGAALSLILLLVTGLSAWSWFAIDKPEIPGSPIGDSLVGLLTYVLGGMQVALLVFSIYGFNQKWNIEGPPIQARA